MNPNFEVATALAADYSPAECARPRALRFSQSHRL